MLILILCNFSLSFADMSLYDTNYTPKDLCDHVKEGQPYFSFQSGTYPEPPKQYERYFIPPYLTSLGLSISISHGYNNVKIAMKYGSPPNDYSPNVLPEELPANTEYYTVPPLYPIRSVDELYEEAVIKVGSGGSEKYDLMNLTTKESLFTKSLESEKESWLYTNLFSERNRVLKLKVNMYFDREPFLDWCDGKTAQGPSKPIAAADDTWSSSPQEITFNSDSAEEICYIKNEKSLSNGEVPEDPKNPGDPVRGDEKSCVSGSEGKLRITAEKGEYKKIRINFKAWNEEGESEVSSYIYGLDLRPVVPGQVKVQPNDTETNGKTIKLQVSSENSTKIYYNKVEEDSESGEIEYPAESELGDYQEWTKTIPKSGELELSTESDVHKKVIIQFVGYNPNNEQNPYGEVSKVYKYYLKGLSVKPGPVEVHPEEGSFDNKTNIDVSSANATHILYEVKEDGSVPEKPDIENSEHINGPNGTYTLSGKEGDTVKYKVKFRGYNFDSNSYGPVSDVYQFDVTRSASQEKEECKAQGGIWFNNHCFVAKKSKGYLKIAIDPESAIVDGAKWRRQGTDQWNDSSSRELVPVGTHTVEFKEIEGWKTPEPITVSVEKDKLAEGSASYSEDGGTGYITVYIQPAEAVSTGAQWGVNQDKLYDSGHPVAVESGTYDLYFLPVEGWVEPDDTSVEIEADMSRDIVVRYTRPDDLSYKDENVKYLYKNRPEYRLTKAFRNPESKRIELDLALINGKSLKDFIMPLLSNKEMQLSWDEKQGEVGIGFDDTGGLKLKLMAAEVFTTQKNDGIKVDESGKWTFIQDELAVEFEPVWYDQSVKTTLEQDFQASFRDTAAVFSEGNQQYVFRPDYIHGSASGEKNHQLDGQDCTLWIKTDENTKQHFVPYVHDVQGFADLLNQYGLTLEVSPYPLPYGQAVIKHYSEGELVFKGSPSCRLHSGKEADQITLELVQDENGDGLPELLLRSPLGGQKIFSSY